MARAKVTVLGWYGKGNIGDEAYKLAFPLVFPHTDFNFVDDVTEGSVYENIILGGGDVYNDFFIKKMKKASGRKFAMSVNCTNKELFETTVGMFERVFFRAANNSCAAPDGKVSVFPDFTFALRPSFLKGKQLIEEQFKATNSDKYKKTVVVIMNSFLAVKEGLLARDYLNFEKVAVDLAQVCDETNASFLFLPFTNGFPHNDRITNSVVYSRCKFWKKNSLWYRRLDVQEALDICCAADLVISSRLHGGIFSTIGATPFIDITHHTKTRAFLDFIKRPYWSLNYWRFDTERLRSLLGVLLGDHEDRFMLEKIATSFREELQAVQSCVRFQPCEKL